MKKKIIYDAFLNIVASSLPLIALQLLILPVVGSVLGDAQYGLIITLVSLTTLLSHPFGNVLNNIRLLQNDNYDEKKYCGDFNILLVCCIIINSIIMIVGTIYYDNEYSIISILLVVMISIFTLAREYFIVAFRIKLDYKAILMNNVILGIGYLLGLGIFHLFGYWQFIYIIGSISSLSYIMNKTNLIHEGFKRTPLFKDTTYKSLVLFLSVFMKTALSYADKLVLFPLLGPRAVSIYYTATILGKLITRIITPVSGVMLSYFAKMKKFKMKDFIQILSLTAIVGVIGYVISILISEPILKFLYPNWANESLNLIYITTATTIFGVMSSVIHPIVLRFNNVNWQLLISGSNLVVSVIAVILLFNMFGLYGFCLGLLVANVIKLLIMISIFIFNYYHDYMVY